MLQQEEALLLEVGRLRREAPAKAAEMRREALQKEIEDVLRDINDGGDEGGDVELGVEKLERMEDVEASYKRGVQGLVRLKTELPATAARMEQAKRAGEYVLGEK